MLVVSPTLGVPIAAARLVPLPVDEVLLCLKPMCQNSHQHNNQGCTTFHHRHATRFQA